MTKRIKLLGTMAVEENGRSSRIMGSSRGLALVAYLAYTNDVQTRETVADLLWEASSTRQSLARLRELLGRVRRWLPEVQATRKTITLEATADIVIDLQVLRDGLAAEDIVQVDNALRLYDGDFLSPFYVDNAPYFNEWAALARERLRTQVLAAHHRLCQMYASAEAWHKGADVARRWVALDGLNEEGHRWLMQMLAQSGQARAALQAYDDCCQLLAAELGIEPESATTQLAQRLSERVEATVWDNLSAETLSKPGLLPANAMVRYQRNWHFVGREREMLQIAHSFGGESENGRSPVVIIAGMGGVGKSQTAVEFCYRYGRYFSGGVFWINFAEPANVAEEIAAIGSERGLGLFQEMENLSLADQVGRVQRAWQAPTPRLLIFDNCEDEALLATWLPVTGGCRVLVTSRRRTWTQTLGITAVALQPFNAAESVSVLQQLASHIAPADSATIAAEVGCLPLALHLVGGFLNRYRHITAVAYLAQLRQAGLLQHPSLQGHGLHHSPTDYDLNLSRTYLLNLHQLNRTDEIDEMAYRLLRHAACFAPGEAIDRALLLKTAVANHEDTLSLLLAEDGLIRLVNLGFLNAKGHETVMMHHLLFAFTHEVVAVDEMREGLTAVAHQLVHILTAHRQQAGHLSTFPFAISHLRHVYDGAIAQKHPIAAQLAILLGLHLLNIGERTAAEQQLQQAYRLANKSDDAQIQAKALTALAMIQESMGRDEDSLASAQQAAELFKQAQPLDTEGLVAALYRQGWAHYRLGQAEAALQAAQEGYAISESTQLLPEKARCLSLLGVVNYYMLSEYAAAEGQMEESLAIYRQLGNRQAEGSLLNNLGENARLQGNYAVAVSYYEAALTIAREINNGNKADVFLSNLCGARIRLRQHDRAATDLESIIAHTQQDWYGLSEAYRFLAEAYLGQERLEPALTAAQQALLLAHPANQFENGRSWRVLALIAAAHNSPIADKPKSETQYDATACFAHSLTFFHDTHSERDRAITLCRWAQYELAQGDREHGHEIWAEAQKILSRLNLPLLTAHLE